MNKKVLIIGNKPYHNFKLDNILDSFDLIYRFNFACPGKNNGTKFGKLAMCHHVFFNLVENPISEEKLMEVYYDMDNTYLSNWYAFFQANKEKFDEIYHQNEHIWDNWNRMLREYGSPYRLSKMATTGLSTIFRNLADNNEIYLSSFTVCDDEIRKTIGETDEFIQAKIKDNGCHSYSEEINIITWLHNNKKIDASLCMLDDTEEISIKTNHNNMKPSKFIFELMNKK